MITRSFTASGRRGDESGLPARVRIEPAIEQGAIFARKFSEAGVGFEAPALDGGDFEKLTITGQLEVVGRAVERARSEPGEVVLMGSSLGGYLAALYTGRHPDQVDKLILLAPAFQFLERWRQRLRLEEFDAWHRQGWAPIYHYGAKREMRLGRQFLEDGATYPAEPEFPQPALILHGRSDPVVPYEVSSRYTLAHPHARLVPLDSAHELTDVLDALWAATAEFLWN